MNDLLSFLTIKLKQNRMTVDDFCKKIGISRQKFYRFVKEPKRFSNDHVQAAIDVLGLTGSEVTQFRGYLHPVKSDEYLPVSQEYYGLIDSLLRHHFAGEFSADSEMIEYTQAGRPVTKESPSSLALILAGLRDNADHYAAEDPTAKLPDPQANEYEVTIYNCVPSYPDASERWQYKPARSIQIIASVMEELSGIVAPLSSASIRIRHYLSKARCSQMKKSDISNTDAVIFRLRLLDAVLPILSMMENYSIDLSDNIGKFWTEHANMCLIRHIRHGSSKDSQNPNESSDSPSLDREIYYALSFSDEGDCYACRLGSDEVSHIFHFLSINSPGKEQASANRITGDPNQFYYQLDKEYRSVLIHPDLCFDNIPWQVWLSLYKEIIKSDNRVLYEEAYRKVIDPHDLYAFLPFKDLVDAAVQTLTLRAEASARMGNSVLCHPDGLLQLVQTGMISDLTSGETAFAGKAGDFEPLRFPPSIIRELLEIIKSSILRRQAAASSDPETYDWVNYYILKPLYPCPKITFIIYDNLGVSPIYTKGRYKNRLINTFNDPVLGSILYNYVMKEMIQKRGKKLDSDVMSDEHSIALIDNLISMIDKNSDRVEESEEEI